MELIESYSIYSLFGLNYKVMSARNNFSNQSCTRTRVNCHHFDIHMRSVNVTLNRVSALQCCVGDKRCQWGRSFPGSRQLETPWPINSIFITVNNVYETYSDRENHVDYSRCFSFCCSNTVKLQLCISFLYLLKIVHKSNGSGNFDTWWLKTTNWGKNVALVGLNDNRFHLEVYSPPRESKNPLTFSGLS